MRSQRGDDVRAERCRRVGRDQAALGGVLGVHVFLVDFTWFLGGTDWINRTRAQAAGPRFNTRSLADEAAL